MKKKGFTLVELLAVIVILAVIALIAVPVVLNMIEKARIGSAEDSAYSYVKGIEDSIVAGYLSGNEYNSGIYNVGNIKVNVKGSTPTNGEYTLDDKNEVISGKFCINGYSIDYDGKHATYNKDADYCNMVSLANLNMMKHIEKNEYWNEKITLPNNTTVDEYSRVEFTNTNIVPDDAVISWDVSLKGDGSIMAWVLEEEKENMSLMYEPTITETFFEKTLTVTQNRKEYMLYISPNYILYIGSKEKIYLNPDSSYLFGTEINYENGKIKVGEKSLFSFTSAINFNNMVDTSKVTNMEGMFAACSKLISLNVSDFNTSNVTNMRGMFIGCEKLSTLDVSNFNTSNVTNMEGMFAGNINLSTLNLNSFNTSKVTNMRGMFMGCEKLSTLDVSNFNTSNVTNMSGMFMSCEKLSTLDVSNFNTSRVTDMSGMFVTCSSLTSLNVSNFDTSKVTDMHSMFSALKITNLDISNFDTFNVNNMLGMFAFSSNLSKIYVGNNWKINSGTNTTEMFYLCGTTSTTLK